MIIWDEYKFGKEVYDKGATKTKKWQTNELRALVKYLLIKNPEMSNAELRNELEKCCTDEIKYLSKKQKTNIFNKLIQQCYNSDKNVKITQDKNVVIYKSEIEKIKKLMNIHMEQIMFTLLVYNKWLHLNWFSISKSDLQKESKTTNLNSKKFQDCLSDLFELQYIKSDVIKLDKHERRKEKIQKKQMWNIAWLQNDGDIAFEFNNYDNFVYRYLNYVYGGYSECEHCGVLFKQSKNNSYKYCAKHRGYQPIGTKIIKCIDCGKEVKVDAKDNETNRCKECYEIYRKIYKAIKEKERRIRLKQ